jgi:hypothetical protein
MGSISLIEQATNLSWHTIYSVRSHPVSSVTTLEEIATSKNGTLHIVLLQILSPRSWQCGEQEELSNDFDLVGDLYF